MSFSETIDEELDRLSVPSVFKVPRTALQQLAIDETACAKIAEYFDCETGGECSKVRYVQQVLLEVNREIRIERHEAWLSRDKSGSF